jgi:hypothetical protein
LTFLRRVVQRIDVRRGSGGVANISKQIAPLVRCSDVEARRIRAGRGYDWHRVVPAVELTLHELETAGVALYRRRLRGSTELALTDANPCKFAARRSSAVTGIALPSS